MKAIKVNIKAGLTVPSYHTSQAEAMADRPPVPLPDDLADWFGRLRLLYGVPFEYLVPEERLLPKESIRFFYVDQNWMDRLVDGALTIGKVGTRDYYQYQTRVDAVRESLAVCEATIRTTLRGEEVELENVQIGGTLSGVMIRSSLVVDYPGLEIRAYDRVRDYVNPSSAVKKLPLLRMDRLAPDILFCLFQGIPKHLEVEEPREGIQWGVDSTDHNKAYFFKREADGSYDLDANDDQQTISTPFKRGNKRVLDVAALAQSIGGSSGGVANSSELATQFLQFPYLQHFNGDGNCVVDDASYTGPFGSATNFNLLDIEAEHRVLKDIRETIEGNLEEIVGLDTFNLDPIFIETTND